jgi:hypothetical protein
MSRSRYACFAVVVLLAVGLSGCTRVGTSSVVPPELRAFESGIFGGTLTVDGTEMEGLLQLSQSDGRFAAKFESQGFGFEAEGEGRLRGERLELVLSYEMECRGELRMRGTFRPTGGGWDGELVASDCTGDASGTFRFVPTGR